MDQETKDKIRAVNDEVYQLQLKRAKSFNLTQEFVYAFIISIKTEINEYTRGVFSAVGLSAIVEAMIVAEEHIFKSIYSANDGISRKEANNVMFRLVAREDIDEKMENTIKSCEGIEDCLTVLAAYTEILRIINYRILIIAPELKKYYPIESGSNATIFYDKAIEHFYPKSEFESFNIHEKDFAYKPINYDLFNSDGFYKHVNDFFNKFKIDAAIARCFYDEKYLDVNAFNIGVYSALGLRFIYLPFVLTIDSVVKQLRIFSKSLSDEDMERIYRCSVNLDDDDKQQLMAFGFDEDYLKKSEFINNFSRYLHNLNLLSNEYLEKGYSEPKAYFKLLAENAFERFKRMISE